MPGSVIVAGARTPMGRLLGSLKDFSGADLGGVAIKAALERAGITGDQVEYVIMGQVLQAGTGQITARQAAVKAGIPMSTPGADGEQGVPVRPGRDRAGRPAHPGRRVRRRRRRRHGVDDQRAAPAAGVREGYKYGAVEMLDAMAYDGLTDAFDHVSMGESTERHNGVLNLTREEQDAFAARSHQLAAVAAKNGIFDEEITPVEVPQRKGDPVVFASDEGIRPDTTVETLARLRPAFHPEGTITAATSSQISDGACAVVVMSRAKADELGLSWLAEIGAHGNVAGPDNSLQSQPANAIKHALGKEGIAVADLDLVEINEAFAAVAVQSMRELGLDRGQGQRQRRRDRARPPDRHVRRPAGTHARARAAAPRRRRRGRRRCAAAAGRATRSCCACRPRRPVAAVPPADVPALVEAARAGNARAVARLISLVEDASPRLREVMAALAPVTGQAYVVGITGAPGVGKSTSTSALVGAFRASGRRVGVLAVDPSSPFSGGALLGDRVRMQDHALDRGVYIRSMASRGHLGGLAWSTPQAIRVLDAAGCDVILVETVGVGQSEVEIASNADTTLVLLAPGMGDAIQAAKAGILEIGDVYVVNKADRDGAHQVVRELRKMLALAERQSGDWARRSWRRSR